MELQEQTGALAITNSYIQRYGKLLWEQHRQWGAKGSLRGAPGCNGEYMKSHMICKGSMPQTPPCIFVSFGVNRDYRFEVALAEEWGCRGFAADPTITHPSSLHELVTFHNLGANTLDTGAWIRREGSLGTLGNNNVSRAETQWWSVSVPGVSRFLGLGRQRISMVKLDCEGCEFALARDILMEDPLYLRKVDQIAIETHVSRSWLNSTEHLYYFGLMFALLEEAGLKLAWSSIFGCSKRHEVTGCLPELRETGFPCKYKPWPGHPKVVHGFSCQDMLFYRPRNQYAVARTLP